LLLVCRDCVASAARRRPERLRVLRGHVRRAGDCGRGRRRRIVPGAALDRWTDADWNDYRQLFDDGEGSCAAIDAINRRRGCKEQSSTSAAADASW
jgi:hypothetical protein